MKFNRALAFLISMTMLTGVLPVSAMAADYAGDGITMDMEVGDPCADGHDYESVITREPTCEKTGIETFTCTVCGDSYDEEIPRTDHEYDGGRAENPTCTKAGKVIYTCTVCGHTRTEEGEPALGHSYKEKEIKATCEKAGKIVYTCTRCGDKYEEEGEEALGHDYEEKVTKPATETAEGEMTYTCKRCKDSYKEAIPKLKKSDKKDDGKKAEDKKADEKDGKKESSCKVTLPSGKGYVIMAMGDTTVDPGESFSFTINIAEGYQKGKSFSVKAGDSTLKESSDGTYTIKNIKKDVKVKVSGVEKTGDMDEDLIVPDPEEEDESAGAAAGAAFATDDPAVPADEELLADDPLNSAESEYKLYVYGIPVTADNKGDILGENDDEDGDAKKTAVYDDEENTLTLDALDDATITLEHSGPAVKYEGTEKLTIIFKGNCFLVGNEEENAESGSEGCGIYAPDGSLHIEAGGEGELRISNPNAIIGKDVDLDEKLCVGPEGVIQNEHGITVGTGDEPLGVSIASSHQWSATDYVWSDDYSSCTATKHCTNNSEHTGTGEGTVTSHYEEPTEDEPGKTVYTATFEDKVFEDQTAEVEDPSNPALGYDLYVWGDPVTDENQDDVIGDKTVTYDPEQNILKLNGATITAPGDGPAIRYNGEETLTIEFTGNNSLTGTPKEGVGDGETAYGIFAADGSIVIRAGGTGELRITNEKAIAGKNISIDESLCKGPEGIRVIPDMIPGGTGYSSESGMVISSSHDWSEWKKSETEEGKEERTCSKCGETQTRDLQHEHTLEEIKEKKATCTEDGHIAYYQCSVCKLLFKDKEAKTEITTADLVPEGYKATGHDWNEPTYTWADDYSKVTAARVCKNDNTHVEKEEAAAVKEGTEPTCEAAGDLTYTAAFKNDGFTEQEKKVQPAALGHQWGAPVFSWSNGNTKATATVTCRRDSSHTKTVNASVKGMITMPTMTADGKITYTASVKVDNKTISENKEAPIKPAGTTGYKFTTQGFSWTKGSSSLLNMAVKRNEYDAITYRAFTGITIDGKTVSSSNYSTAKGSLKLALKKEYLQNNLAVGAHTLKVQFRDGTAETKFTVRGTTNSGSKSSTSKSSTSPKTGDTTNVAMWIGILIAAVLGIAAILIYRKRKNTKK